MIKEVGIKYVQSDFSNELPKKVVHAELYCTFVSLRKLHFVIQPKIGDV